MKSVESISMLMIACAKFLDLTRILTKQEDRHESETLVNILIVNSFLVLASRLNGIEAPFIYSFFPDVAPGDKIVSTPLHLIYIPLMLNIIYHMTCWLTDQNGKELDLRGEEVTITFHVKSC